MSNIIRNIIAKYMQHNTIIVALLQSLLQVCKMNKSALKKNADHKEMQKSVISSL